jgi:hypothetical protein
MHFRTPEWSPERAVSFAISLVDEVACLPILEEYVSRAVEQQGYGYGGFVLLVGTHRLRKGSGMPFLPSLAPLIELRALRARGVLVDYVREVLTDAPNQVRDEIALRMPLKDRVERVEKVMGREVGRTYAGWNVLDLAADRAGAARRGVENVSAWTPLPESAREIRPIEEVQRALIALRPEAIAAFNEAKDSATPYGKATLEALLYPN